MTIAYSICIRCLCIAFALSCTSMRMIEIPWFKLTKHRMRLCFATRTSMEPSLKTLARLQIALIPTNHMRYLLLDSPSG